VPVFSVLFVCIGNVCRSPMGERLLAQRLVPGRAEVSSAGVGALVGHPMDADAAAFLADFGGTAEGFLARRMTPEMAIEADLVLTATKDIRERVLRVAPATLRRTFTAVEFAKLMELVSAADAKGLVQAAATHRAEVSSEDLDIVDPYRRSKALHRVAATHMAEAVDVIADRFAEFGLAHPRSGGSHRA
jgi:protein-tyrosine phosphatase